MNKIKWILTILSLGIALFLIVACDFNNISNPADKLEVRVKNIARSTFVSFEILDAKTNNPISKTIEAEIEGTDNGLVINEINEPTTFFSVENGVLLFAIADGTEPTSDNPVKLNVLLKADDYISTSQPILVTKTGMNTYSTVMTNVDNTPIGVVSNQENAGTTSVADGMTDTTVVSSGEDNESGGEASISIAPGTILKDENGEPLSGSVEARVTYFNPLNEESKAAFPGGFSVEIDGEEEGLFTTAGFVAVDMTVDGDEVEQFEGDVNINIKVPEGTINPETGQPVKAGDEIPVYSYDEDAGTWQYEGTTTVPAQSALGKSTGTHTVTIKDVKHLSYWNLDWFDGYNYCYTGSTLKFTSTTGTFQWIKVRICDQGTDNLASWSSSTYVYPYDNVKDLYYVTANSPVTIKIYDSKGVLVKEQDVNDLCANQEVEIEFTPSVTSLQVNVNVQIRCEDAAVTPNGMPLYAKEKGNYWKYLGTVTDGQIGGAFVADAYYNFMVQFDGQWYYTNNYADDIVKRAADQGYTINKDSDGYLQMTPENENISILLEDIESICDEF